MNGHFKKSRFADYLRYLREISLILTPPSRAESGFYFNGNSQQKAGTYEIEIADYIKSNISQFDLLINVGANIGYWPCFASSIRKLEVIAIEPDQFNYLRHRLNKFWNRYKNITILKLACGNESGLIELYGFGTGISGVQGWAGGNSRRSKQVEQIRLDSLLCKIEVHSGRILILIDAEGLEWDILNGCTGLMSLNPVFIVEISTTEHQPISNSLNPHFFETFDFMKANGFLVKTWIDGKIVEVDRLLLLKIARGEINFATNHMFMFEAVH